MPNNMATATVGVSPNGNTQSNGGMRAGIRIGWPTERWVALIVLLALGMLILIRVGFRGVGLQGNIGAKVSL